MPLVNVRRQYAVGQGYFQAGELQEDGVLRLRYVVDCGAMTKYAATRDARIDEYLEMVGAKQPLDLLFVSHAHADHLNGVARLLDKVNGLAVKTIVMPLLNIEDRLIAYARAASEDMMSAEESFFRAFVADPASALSRFGPEQIIFVEPGNRSDGGAPFSGGPDGPGGGRGDPDSRLPGNEPPKWQLVGTGEFRRKVDVSTELEAGVVDVMPDTLGFRTMLASTTAAWMFAPFVDPAVKANSSLFMASLAAARSQPITALKRWLRRTGNVEKLLTVYVSDLKAAYAAIQTDLNVTSMCLYSGPVPAVTTRANSYAGRFGKWSVSQDKAGVAWLGTGDAALADKKRREAFLKHYGALLEEVVTLTLPHHGSDYNFHAALLDRIRPDFCVASADQFSTWRHPGTAVAQSVASAGRFLSVVTSNVDSEIIEWALVK
jgi:hypothetical protein